MEVAQAMLKEGLQSSLSDAGVGILCARAAVVGAYFNVRINAKDIKDASFAKNMLQEAKKIYEKSLRTEAAMMKVIDEKM